MARIRTIKPEFFTSADIVALTPLARLFYVALWCEADREGLLSWNPETLKLRYFPADKVDIEKLASELLARGLIAILVGSDGKEYAEIPQFQTHQVINNRESESVLAARVKDASPRVAGEGRKEGKGKEGNTRTARDAGEPRFDSSTELSKRGVQPQTIADWLKLRQTQKAPVTETVLTAFIAEADKAGMSLERVLTTCCLKGWRGFKAEWVKGDADDDQPPKQDWE